MKLAVIGLVCLAFFAVFSRQVRDGRFTLIDFAVTVKVQDYVRKLDIQRFEGVLEDIGILASPTFSIIAVGVLIVFSWNKLRFRTFLIPMAFILLIAAEIYGKSVVHHPAPPFFLLKNPTTIFPKYHVWEEFSYPSGHAARAVFIALVTYFLLPKKKKIWLVAGLGLYVVLIILSRIYLGHHWLSDIFGGLLLGVAFAIIGR